MFEFIKKNCVSKNSLSLLKYEEPLGNSNDNSDKQAMWNGSKTEETVLFCFFVVLPPQGQIGLTKLLDSEGQSICLLRLYCLSLSYDICKLARVETLGSTRCSSYHDYTEPKVLEYFNSAQALYFLHTKTPRENLKGAVNYFCTFLNLIG